MFFEVFGVHTISPYFTIVIEFALISHFFYKNTSLSYILKDYVLAGNNLESRHHVSIVRGLYCKINSSRLVDHQKLLSCYLIGKSRT